MSRSFNELDKWVGRGLAIASTLILLGVLILYATVAWAVLR